MAKQVRADGQFETRIPPRTKARVVKLYRDGKKVHEITEATGVSKSSVYWVLREQGVQTRNKPGPRPRSVLSSLPSSNDQDATLSALVEINEALRERLQEQAEEIGRLRAELRAGREGHRGGTDPRRGSK